MTLIVSYEHTNSLGQTIIVFDSIDPRGDESNRQWEHAFNHCPMQQGELGTYVIMEDGNVAGDMLTDLTLLAQHIMEDPTMTHYDLELYRTGMDCWIKHVALNAPMGDSLSEENIVPSDLGHKDYEDVDAYYARLEREHHESLDWQEEQGTDYEYDDSERFYAEDNECESVDTMAGYDSQWF